MNVPSIPPINWSDISDYVVLAGSHGYGTDTATSDRDLRGFFLPPVDELLSFREAPDSRVTQADGKDDAFWEIRKFFRMCMTCNPNVLETLFVHPENVLRATEVGMQIRESRQLFLSQRIGTTYLGYASGNFKRVLKQRGTFSVRKEGPYLIEAEFPLPYDGKDAMHMVRLVRTGLEALRTGQLRIRRDEDREEFLAIKEGKRSFEDVKKEFESAEKEWRKVQVESVLPEHPNENLLHGLIVYLLGEHVCKRLVGQ